MSATHKLSLKPFLILACAAAVAGVVALPAAAQAAPATTAAAATAPPVGATKIAIINIEQAISETAEGKKLVAGVEARFAPRTAALASAQKEIDTLNKQLNDQSNTMSDAAKAQIQQEVQTKERDAQQQSQNAQSDYQQAQADVLTTVGTKMMPVIKKYADEHGYTEVIDVSQRWPQNTVLYFNPGTDITETIVKLYDAAHPAPAASTSTSGH